MSKVFDVVLSSNDLSLDRVLGAGLPVAMVFYDKDLPADLRHIMDDLARHPALAFAASQPWSPCGMVKLRRARRV